MNPEGDPRLWGKKTTSKRSNPPIKEKVETSNETESSLSDARENNVTK